MFTKKIVKIDKWAIYEQIIVDIYFFESYSVVNQEAVL